MSKNKGKEEKEELSRCDLASRKKKNLLSGVFVGCCSTRQMAGGCGVGESSGLKSQDADYSIPSLGEELELSILARFPQSEQWKLASVSKRYLDLVKSGELFKIRKEIGYKEPYVFMLASGESSWMVFDRTFQTCRRLPILPSDTCFLDADKESLCAGTHLIVTGRELTGGANWRYQLVENIWIKGSSMISPRCLFASASCGTNAFVAGGIALEFSAEGAFGMGMEYGQTVLNTAEKYNPESLLWEPLPNMHQARKKCSGCFMDNKFYVIGGRDRDGNHLTCGEVFDEEKNSWDLIENMLEDAPISTSQSPPLVAVVNNELYSLEPSSNALKVYLKRRNEWKNLGPVPVLAVVNRGWGVAFKSLGDELLVIGASSESSTNNSMSIYTCTPDPRAERLQWRRLDCGTNHLSPFILNCCVMVA
ncbi:F-box/kelch-repeat protein At3g27150 [Momordica charantia]|uniref:F-box/kelch-repeat protein At3g27150 n=1 Tax=Momordica charantia TaxID=3673 RepID=A0A6J1DQU2_MOMCH|nr:F-box/kelch-repeat protein At3g27150 [Momordica charantia]XP_022156513.1 F-box/kelch-repeat protein At3g27150 [Momordica charantia]